MELHYKDLEEYGIVGNLETCALVGRDGSIDWACFPFLESPSVFAALLDIAQGGHFCIRPIRKYESSQSYINNTNVLQTIFKTAQGRTVVTDFMPIKNSHTGLAASAILRKIECVSGSEHLEVSFKPRFNYGEDEAHFKPDNEGIIATYGSERLNLYTPISLAVEKGEAATVVNLKSGEVVWLALMYKERLRLSVERCEELLEKTTSFWRNWSQEAAASESITDKRWHKLVIRSSLALKLLTNPDTGGVAAAATTSLPERIGGVRNWDYRYAWIRDTSLTMQAFFHLGHETEARDFRRWNNKIVDRARDPGHIQTMYGLHGEANLEERILKHLSGYKNSRPVRIGNDAAKQKQLDIYGELVNTIFETTRYGEDVSEQTRRIVTNIVDYVCREWNTKDSGIWEVRGGPRHFVYSKLMCWLAVDRAIKMSRANGFKAPLRDWEKARNDIRRAILERGYDESLNSFVQSFGSRTLDATSLQILLTEFLPPKDPRVQGTINAILERLTTREGLVYRYEGEDNLPGKEGAFVLCSFWLIKALALSGRIEEAEEFFGNILDYASPVGLFAEEIDPGTGKQLGNFPQAFSHIGLINSSLYLGVAKGGKHKGPRPTGMTGLSPS